MVFNEIRFDGMTLMYRKLSLMFVALGVSACGGSTDATTKVMQPNPPPAATVLQLTDVEIATSQVIGVAILDQSERIAAGSPVFDTTKAATTRIEGSYNHHNSVAALSGADIAFEGMRSRDSFLETAAQSYDHMRVSQAFLATPPGEDFRTDVAITSLAIYGIATPASDIPVSGDATFTGDGQLSVRLPSGSTSYQAAVSVTANFLTNRAGMTMTSNADPDPEGVLDGLEMENMRINGSRITGGAPIFMQQGKAVSPFAGSFTKFAEAQFYGTDGDTPDEVGGIVELTDGRTTITGVFIAD